MGECGRVRVGGWVHVCSVGDAGGLKEISMDIKQSSGAV